MRKFFKELFVSIDRTIRCALRCFAAIGCATVSAKQDKSTLHPLIIYQPKSRSVVNMSAKLGNINNFAREYDYTDFKMQLSLNSMLYPQYADVYSERRTRCLTIERNALKD